MMEKMIQQLQLHVEKENLQLNNGLKVKLQKIHQKIWKWILNSQKLILLKIGPEKNILMLLNLVGSIINMKILFPKKNKHLNIKKHLNLIVLNIFLPKPELLNQFFMRNKVKLQKLKKNGFSKNQNNFYHTSDGISLKPSVDWPWKEQLTKLLLTDGMNFVFNGW